MALQRQCAGGTAGDPAYWCFQLLGAGTLIPWNVLITAADWWEARYPGKHTDRLLTISYLPVNLVVIAAMVHWHARVHPRVRVLGGLLGFTLTLFAVVLIDFGPPTLPSMAAVLLLVALCGMCDGLAQGALFGEVALLPPRYTQALVAGTAASGVVVSLLRVVTKATLPDTQAGLRCSANLYFCIAALVCAACTIVYGYILPRLPPLRQYKHASLEAAIHSGSSGDEVAGWKLAMADGEQTLAGDQQQQLLLPALELSSEDHIALHPHQRSSSRDEDQPEEQSPGQALLQGQHGLSGSGGDGHAGGGCPHRGSQLGSSGSRAGMQAGSGTGPLTSWTVLPLVWRLAAALTLTYTVTLSVFPGVLAEDVHSAELGSWYPVALITAFNPADFAGKSLPGAVALRLRNPRGILVATLSRALFIPAFHFAAVGSAGPAVISLLSVLLGFSNGYLTACAMMEAPAEVPPAAAEVAGNLMVLFLVLGLGIGAACGFLWLL